jgi:hypothetical protein
MTATHASKDQLAAETVALPELGDYESRTTQFGDYYVRFESIPAGFDDAELHKGLPNDACPCEHSGYLFKGRFKFGYTDGGEDVVSAGEAYYARPGHTFEVLEDSENVEFSPKDPVRSAHGGGNQEPRGHGPGLNATPSLEGDRSGRLQWPRRGGLKWPQLASVVVYIGAAKARLQSLWTAALVNLNPIGRHLRAQAT